MSPSIRALMQRRLPVTAPVVLNPLMARMVVKWLRGQVLHCDNVGL